MSRGRGIALALVLAVVALALPATARAETSVTLFSDPGDWVGGGGQWSLTPAEAEITVDGYTSWLWVEVADREGDGWRRLEFAAPRGEVLTPGVYDNAMRAAFRDDGRPGLDIGVDRWGCDDVTGRFEVKAIDVTPEGLLRRLWIVYEQHCEGATPALFGEVRIGMPGPAASFAEAPALVRWPLSEQDRTNTTVAVRLVATAAATAGAAQLGGPGAADFRIADDGCAGRTLAAGEDCVVWVAYAPADRGPSPSRDSRTAGAHDCCWTAIPATGSGTAETGRSRRRTGSWWAVRATASASACRSGATR